MLSADALYEDLLAAFRAWQSPATTGNDLLTHLLIVQGWHQQAIRQEPAVSPRQATNLFLDQQLRQLAEKDPVGAQILRDRFGRQQTVQAVAPAIGFSVDSVQRRQRQAIEQLVASLLPQEQQQRAASSLRLENNLPPPTYSQLFGVEAIVEAVAGRLLSGQLPYITAIAGLGGIGKTALADQLVRRVLRHFHFEGVVWVRYQPAALDSTPATPQAALEQLMISLSEPAGAGGLLPGPRNEQIRQMLKSQPYLVVVDNVEEEASLAHLLAELPHYTNPSQLLLTTRAQPAAHLPAYSQSLPELGLADGIALLRYEAALQNLPEMAAAAAADLNQIYQLVGGNPLALKLTVGLAKAMPLAAILAELERQPRLASGRLGPAEKMYRHIYWQAWQSLGPEAQSLLAAMIVVAETGAQPAQLQAISGLSEAALWAAIRDLVARSLLEVRGTLAERRYGIHRLTATFLRTEIF